MMIVSKQKQILGLFVWFMISFLASAVGALASIQAKTFYAELLQPNWAPSAQVFGPVWTLLFALMAVAAWLVWRADEGANRKKALQLFLLQLAVNGLWSWLFFAWHLGGLALINVVVLWLMILITMLAFWRVNKLASALLLPYLLWVSFAIILNATLWQMNPQIL
jgi:tryptophan-rich sensory protein